jgi:hypothetical protein
VGLKEAWYSPNYGKKYKNKVVVLGLTGKLPYRSRTVVIPYERDVKRAMNPILEKKQKATNRLKLALERGVM